jgi:hypothetical protein
MIGDRIDLERSGGALFSAPDPVLIASGQRQPFRPESARCGGAQEGLGDPLDERVVLEDRQRRTEVAMSFAVLDTVVLVRDLPEHGLKAGDLGAVVEVYPPDGLEVEFVTASGRTTALVTLSSADVRVISDSDLVAIRSLSRTA